MSCPSVSEARLARLIPDSYLGKREAPGLLVLGPLVWLAAVLAVVVAWLWGQRHLEAGVMGTPVHQVMSLFIVVPLGWVCLVQIESSRQ